MSKPNKTVAAFRSKMGTDPAVVEARNKRFEASIEKEDIAKFQAGQMTAEEFQKRWMERMK